MFDGVEVLTWDHCSVDEQVYIDTELCDGGCIQDGRNRFVLPRYRVGPVMVRTGELVQAIKEYQTFESGRFG